MTGPTRFADYQMKQIHRNLRQAEGCLEKFYSFAPREWFHFSYEVLTARDLPPEFSPRHHRVFAEVLRNFSASRHRPDARHTFYSIVLFDPHILRHIQEFPAVSFDRLILYILTHELVHVARFFHLMDYDLPDDEKVKEEFKVHTLTSRILAQLNDAELDRLSGAYLSGDYTL